MQHHEISTSSSGPHWGEKEKTVSVPVPLMTGTEVSYIPASVGNLVSHVRADGNENISSVLTD